MCGLGGKLAYSMPPTLPIAAEEWTAPSARNFDVPMGGVVMRGGGVTVGGDSSTGSSVMAASRKKSLYVKLEKMDSMPVSSEGSSTGADCTLGGTWPIREAPACCSSGNMTASRTANSEIMRHAPSAPKLTDLGSCFVRWRALSSPTPP